MGNFKVKFGIDSSYSDPDYRYIYVKVVGEAEVSCEDRDGSDHDQEIVKGMIGIAIMNVLSDLSADKISYKDIAAQNYRFADAVKVQLAEKGITTASFRIMSAAPDEKSRTRMAKIDEMKALSQLPPEELAKRQMEAAEEAKRRWEALSPEEKARIEAENKRKAEEAVEQIQKAQELAQKMAAKNDAAGSAAATTAANAAALKAAALGGAPMAGMTLQPAPAASAAPAAASAAAPKFCTNCGAPSKGGKFCGSCGKPL